MHNIIKKNDIKVIISGLGGDEMFTGYYDHFLMHLRELNKSDYKINLKSWKQHIKPLILNQSLRIKPEQGTLVLWPAGYTHIHRGNPPLSGEKYIMTGWLEYDEEKYNQILNSQINQ